MKKQFIYIAVCIASFVMTATANAQNSVELRNKTLPHYTSAKASLEENTVAPEAVVNNLKKQYPAAENASWLKSNSGYTVRFDAGKVENRIYLDKKGISQAVVRVSDASLLPEDYQTYVRNSFSCYAITTVQEVTVGKEKAFIVTIQKNKDWKQVRLQDGELVDIKEYQKG